MSDFGAILIIRKTSGSFTGGDKSTISSMLDAIISRSNYSEIIKTGAFKSLIGWDDDTALCSMLTEYYDDEDSEDVREFAEEEDMDEAAEIAEKLQARLGNGFTVTAAFQDW